MAEHNLTDGAGTSDGTATSPEATVELKIKTLDSRIFTFHVEKTIPVLSFKEKIAGEIGVPVGQQRLIFRGKVLKDEHLLLDYHVENGDTLHLVERQPARPQSSSGTNSGESNVNNAGQGNDGGAGPPRNRIGGISHSVVLGSFNVGDQGDGVVPDVNRVIGAVLNSLGIGNLATANSGVAPQNVTPPPQGSESGATLGDAASQTGGQTRAGPHQAFQFPVAGASVPLPTFMTPIPDSLHTISEFINRMEGVLSQNGNQQNQSGPEPVNQPAIELPSNAGGLPTPEALSIVLRRTQELVTGGLATMLSHIAGRLEQEAGSTDPNVRSQIHTESVRLSLVMQHLGALFMELGRTILTLRMGPSPVESGVHAGPAVYISSSGPNPIMAQPFPHQTSPLFSTASASPTMGAMGPIGIIGSAPRHINIHIHAGATPVPLGPIVGARPRTADGTRSDPRSDRNGVNGSGNNGPQVSSARNVVPGAVPARSAGASPPVSVTAEPVPGASTTLPVPPDIAASVSELNMLLANLVENQAASEATAAPNSTYGLSEGTDATIDQSSNVRAEGSSNVTPQDQKNESDSQQKATEVLRSDSDSTQDVSQSMKVEKSAVDAPMPTGNRDQNSDLPTTVPLGLGLGGLQPKRPSRQSKPKPQSDGAATSTTVQGQPASTSVHQVLRSLASPGSAVSMTDASNTAPRQPPSGSPQLDFQGMMSQFVQSPALNGIFSGLASQAGGSADDLRNMFQSFTQNPAAMNTVSQLAEQISSRGDIQPLLSGLGGGQGGGLDLSRMVQQMMPIVSRALGEATADNEMIPNLDLDLGLEPSNISRRTRTEDRSFDQSSQVDIQQAVQQIMQRSSPQDVFGAVVQNAADIFLDGAEYEELANDLCNDEELANEFVEIFTRDLQDRAQGGSRSSGNS